MRKIDDIESLVIKKYPDKILRKNSIGVEEITDKETELFKKMLFTMKCFDGIGLAAPQIGISEKLIVAEVEEKTIKLANPEIIKVRGVDKMVEGCLSIPDFTVEIERSYEVIVKGLNEKGKNVQIEAEGLLARVLQHEIDHLHGKLIIDYS
ncbi:MAG: peptide deformylase [Clostridiales bacterium]|nr:peptide deformylase [bacterium]MCK5128299.1 peptide deformylase [Clostridiales bacterium]